MPEMPSVKFDLKELCLRYLFYPDTFFTIDKEFVVIGVQFGWGFFFVQRDYYDDAQHLHLVAVLGKTKYILTYDPDFLRVFSRRIPIRTLI